MGEKDSGIGKALAKKLGQDIIPPARERHTTSTSFLMNPVRMLMFLTISEKTGINMRAVARETGSAPSAAKGHLDKLEEQGIIASTKIGGKKHYYLPQIADKGLCEKIHPLAQQENENIYKAIGRSAKGVGQLSKKTGMSPQLVDYHLKLLMKQGLVGKERKKYYATRHVQNIVGQLERQSTQAAEKILALLQEQNLSPSKARKYNNRIRVEVTLGETRKRITIYLVPRTLM